MFFFPPFIVKRAYALCILYERLCIPSCVVLFPVIGILITLNLYFHIEAFIHLRIFVIFVIGARAQQRVHVSCANLIWGENDFYATNKLFSVYFSLNGPI